MGYTVPLGRALPLLPLDLLCQEEAKNENRGLGEILRVEEGATVREVGGRKREHVFQGYSAHNVFAS